MKSLLIISLLSLSGLSAEAQFSPFIIASSGTQTSVGSHQISYTVGELCSVFTGSAGGFTLTHGFQQPENLNLLTVPKLLTVTGFSVYPNPAQEYVEIACTLQSASEVLISLYNMDGSLVCNLSEGQAAKGKYQRHIPLGHHATGLYTLVLKARCNDGSQAHARTPITIIQ
jgi:hypothetical protein